MSIDYGVFSYHLWAEYHKIWVNEIYRSWKIWAKYWKLEVPAILLWLRRLLCMEFWPLFLMTIISLLCWYLRTRELFSSCFKKWFYVFVYPTTTTYKFFWVSRFNFILLIKPFVLAFQLCNKYHPSLLLILYNLFNRKSTKYTFCHFTRCVDVGVNKYLKASSTRS